MVEIKDLCFGYNKGPLFIKDFNLKINKGDKVVLLGGEGMGKTSLLRLLCGLERQYVGLISINGRDVSGLNLKEFGVTYLPSEPVLLKGSLQKNLEYLFKVEGFKLSEKEIKDVFELFDFNFDLNTKVSKLNLADKRIFAIIRAYIKNANVVLIDDQFLNIEEKLFTKIKSALNIFTSKNSVNKTIVFVDFYDLESCVNEFIYLSYGKSYSYKNIKDLFDNPVNYYVGKYCKFNEKDVLIYYKNGEVFVCEYDVLFNKKRKNEEFNIKNMVKIDKNIKNFAKNEVLNDGEYFKAKLVSTCEINELIDKQFNLNLNKKLFLFDALTGERLF